ncbi:MAG: hypothetical protein KatS3mg063_0786 [Tepidiforma sp.]|uniref:DUF5667 domain-containing protein n=2 Tax=Tepidiforma TaxID=2682228 RepID=A0ABX6C2N8_9CHLR|nr:hypothetical protein [Tepidiforma bonchosmolovskayae]QFG03285.1 hypothetical protein Tbon_08245 [Tepidiforma bonchosmolovskayae]GIW14933.1 MAG: hypothetical protein KatS3mg063_0786 [Tepidiforma sp.]
MQRRMDEAVRLAEEVEAALAGVGASPEAAALARIARGVAGLRVPGPDAAASARMRARFSAYVEGEGRSWRTWLLGWLGLGSERRPLVQRLAAGAVLLAAAAGGAQAAGVDTAGALRAAGEFAVNAVRNLDPGRGIGGAELPVSTPPGTTGATAEADPTPASTPEPPGTAAPGSAAPDAAGTAAAPPGSPTQAGATPAPGAGSPPAASPSAGAGTPTATATPSATATPTSPGGISLPPPTATPTPPPTGTPTPPPTATPTPTEKPDDEDGKKEGEKDKDEKHEEEKEGNDSRPEEDR